VLIWALKRDLGGPDKNRAGLSAIPNLWPLCFCMWPGGLPPSAAAHQQKHQQPPRWGTASIPATPTLWAFARQG